MPARSYSSCRKESGLLRNHRAGGSDISWLLCSPNGLIQNLLCLCCRTAMAYAAGGRRHVQCWSGAVPISDHILMRDAVTHLGCCAIDAISFTSHFLVQGCCATCCWWEGECPTKSCLLATQARPSRWTSFHPMTRRASWNAPSQCHSGSRVTFTPSSHPSVWRESLSLPWLLLLRHAPSPPHMCTLPAISLKSLSCPI